MKFKYNGNEYELIILSVAGSHLYGNSRPTSDIDYRGVFIAPNETKLGLIGKVEQVEGKDSLDLFNALVDAGVENIQPTTDIVLYELNRFCELALDNNPNIMDILCYDYTNPLYTKYINDSGKKLLDNKGLFLSLKLKHTFSGYAIAQLKRIKGHNKWINQFPDTDKVLDVLKHNYTTDQIDWDWVCDNFGGQVAEFVSGETAQKHKTLTTAKLEWSQFAQIFDDGRLECADDFDIDKYRLPRLIDYCHPKDLKSKPIKMYDLVYIGNVPYVEDGSSFTMGHFLRTKASFRTHSPSMLTVYDGGKGIFTKDGNLNPNDPETIGDFVCLLSIDHNKYKSDKDYINKLWEWRCNRNEKRSELEVKYGYDTKHASHLVRLMEGCKTILDDGIYEPTLTGDRLDFVNDVRNGKYPYEWVVEYAERLDEELNAKYKNSSLQKMPNHKAVNQLIIDLVK